MKALWFSLAGLLMLPEPAFEGGVRDPGHIAYATPVEPNMLFYLQRTPNANTVVYALRKGLDGAEVTSSPIDIYWKRYEADGRREELNYIQRTFAYGMRVKDLGDRWELRSVAHDKIPIQVYRKHAGALEGKALVTINGKVIVLERIFLHINGGTFWFPNIEYVEFSGRDPVTGGPLVERFHP